MRWLRQLSLGLLASLAVGCIAESEDEGYGQTDQAVFAEAQPLEVDRELAMQLDSEDELNEGEEEGGPDPVPWKGSAANPDPVPWEGLQPDPVPWRIESEDSDDDNEASSSYGDDH